MLNRIRDRFGTAGLVVSIMALVFALAGGAFAASGGLNAKQKKQVKAIAKSFQGTGPAGPAGPAGANGAKGDNGAAGAAGTNGTDGTNGTNGKSVLNGTGAPNASIGTIGDFYIDTSTQEIYGPKAASGINGGWGSPTALKGPQGDPWTAGGTLPVGETETGTWSFNAVQAQEAGLGGGIKIPISFPIPLSSPVTAVFVPSGGSNPNCTGSSANPTAPSGFLCVYGAATLGNATAGAPAFPGITFLSANGNPDEAAGSGAFLFMNLTGDPANGFGNWAVTA